MPRKFEQQLPPTFQLSKTQNLSLSFYLKFKSLANYNITLKSYRNKISQLGWPQLMTPSTSRHVTSRHALGRCFVSTSLMFLRTRHREHLPEIKIRKASEVHNFKFEIVFFLKTDKLKSAFKLRLASPGRNLMPIFSLLYSQIQKAFLN